MSDTKQDESILNIQARLDELEGQPPGGEADAAATVESYLKLAPVLFETWQRGKPMADTISPNKMARKGKADAQALPTVPPSDAKTMSRAEGKLEDRYQTRCEKVYDLYKRFRDGFASSLERLGAELGRLQSAAKTDGDASAHNYYSGQVEHSLPLHGRGMENVGNELKPYLGDFHATKRTFLNFKNDHNLHRYPNYWSATAIWGTAITMIMLESLANGTFYAPFSAAGLIGGWMVAVVVSTVIFGSSFLSGLTLRLVNARKMVSEGSQPKWEKSFLRPIAGVVGFLAIAALTALFIIFVYLYRDVAAVYDAVSDGQAAAAEVMAKTVERFKSMDLAPQANIESVALIVVNALIMLVAMCEGHYAFDCVPGFKRYAQQLAWQRRRFQKKIQAIKHELGITSEQKQRWKRDLRLFSADDLARRIHLHKEGMDRASQLQNERDKDINAAVEECNDALKAYRDANKAARPGTSPPPDYFEVDWKPDTYPPVPAIKPVSFDGFDAAAVAAALISHRAKAMKILRERAAEIHGHISDYEEESNKDEFEVNHGHLDDEESESDGDELGSDRGQADRNGVTNEEGS